MQWCARGQAQAPRSRHVVMRARPAMAMCPRCPFPLPRWLPAPPTPYPRWDGPRLRDTALSNGPRRAADRSACSREGHRDSDTINTSLTNQAVQAYYRAGAMRTEGESEVSQLARTHSNGSVQSPVRYAYKPADVVLSWKKNTVRVDWTVCLPVSVSVSLLAIPQYKRPAHVPRIDLHDRKLTPTTDTVHRRRRLRPTCSSSSSSSSSSPHPRASRAPRPSTRTPTSKGPKLLGPARDQRPSHCPFPRLPPTGDRAAMAVARLVAAPFPLAPCRVRRLRPALPPAHAGPRPRPLVLVLAPPAAAAARGAVMPSRAAPEDEAVVAGEAADDGDDRGGAEAEAARVAVAARAARKQSERRTYLVAAVMSSLGITSMAAAAVYYRFAWQMEVGMEFWARWAHRALWHASLWHMHESHHRPRDGPFELNDVFAIVNAVPAMSLLAYGFFNRGLVPGLCFGAGLGITLFGIAYMFVHDGLVHRRFPVGPIENVPYFRRVAAAHQIHHMDKFQGVPYGLFLGPKELKEVGGTEELEKEIKKRIRRREVLDAIQ
ncbi:uncharacterized protein [Miscanthus floridulus]|uniref:uncharacterized protein isoform X2 n=1 Tax=Miscanthus floridulus TaxID=154761 RepID=UPI00345B3AF1